jgi:drug/metabolite transporter superfamily protein YnfA
MNNLAWLIFILAAILEVVGDAAIRQGLRGNRIPFIVLGWAMLGCYGIVVNTVKWDFSRLLGVYIGFFALVSVLFGRIILRENIPSSTWWGLALIMAGGLIIQFGRR